MPERPVVQKRVFSYAEAAELLPEVRRLTEEACRKADELSTAGVTQRDVEAVIEDWAREMLARGLEVKGLWLVDFDNGSGYYCWKHPEPGLHYFHSYEAGFSGRMPIQ